MTSDAYPEELGEFLSTRRAQLSSRTVGLPDCGTPRRVTGRRTAQRVQPQLRRLLDNLTTIAAVVMGRSTDILAWNPLAAALFTDFAKVPERQRNYARIVFTDPGMKSLYADWELVARTVVAHLRMRAAESPEDARLALLVGELFMRSPEFRRCWAARPVVAPAMGVKTLNHPVVGPLTLDWNLLGSSIDAGQGLVIWTAERSTPSYEGLQILSSWIAAATDRATS